MTIELWALVALALILEVLGRVAKTVLWSRAARWSRLGRRTMRLHPVVCGAAVAGLPGFPVPAWVGPSLVARVLAGACVGAMSSVIYVAVRAKASAGIAGTPLPYPEDRT